MIAVCLPWQLLAMRWQTDSTPPHLGGGSLKKPLLSSYYRAGTRLDDKDTKTTKTRIHPKKKVCALLMNVYTQIVKALSKKSWCAGLKSVSRKHREGLSRTSLGGDI